MMSLRVVCALAIAACLEPGMAGVTPEPSSQPAGESVAIRAPAAAAPLQSPQAVATTDGCSVTSIPAPDPKLDMFSIRQEIDLGDAQAEQLDRDYLVIDDEDVTGYVRRVGAKLLAHAPKSDFPIQFFLFDAPVANAYTFPGGRIYLSRKLVAMLRSEDEMAGVLSHELGHALTHQQAIHMTQLFRDVLGVTEAGSREDIFHNYEILNDSVVTKKKVFRRSGGGEEQDQGVADQVGLQIFVSAGYTPNAFPDFFDRLAQTKGKTGGWLSDFFRRTPPESRRLREMLKQVAAIPTSCKTGAAPASSAEFQKWQASVVSYTGLGHKEQIRDLFSKIKLNPPLQSDLQTMRFSPDGKYLLAQDEATIYVMAREPLVSKFTIYAPEALPAQFSADSQTIVFFTETLRVEVWSVADETRTAVTEMSGFGGCSQADLSPDGKYLACVGENFDLAIYEVATGEQKFLKKRFCEMTLAQWYSALFQRILDPEGYEFIHMRFSPDGRYFIAHGTQDATLALDLDGFRTFSLPSPVRELMWGYFTFLGPGQIVGEDLINPKNSGILKFPSGESVRKMQFGKSHLEASTDLKHIVLRPIKEHPLGVMDLETGAIVLGSEKRAFDAYGDTYIHERVDGDLSVNTFKDAKEVSRLKLPVGQLGYLRAANISPDLRWLAISQHSRGGLWDLLKGERVFYTRGFSSAQVSTQGIVDADFFKFGDSKRQMGRMDPAAHRIDQGREIGDQEVSEFGSVLLRITRKDKNQWKLHNLTIEATDVSTNATLWSRDFPKDGPRFVNRRSDGRLVFAWSANNDAVKLEIENDPGLRGAHDRLQGGASDYFLEVVEPATGKITGALIVRTSKRAFNLESAESSGDWLVAADSENRLLVYSLASGEQTGILFGRRPVISTASSLLAAENQRGQLSVYDLKGLTRRQEYFFTSRIAFTSFAPDNRRIFVLTGDQTAYFLAVPKGTTTAMAH